MVIGGGIEFIVFLLSLFGGGFGIPMGVPPAPEDPLMSQVAPETCVYYSTWAGFGEIDPEASTTEKWMAQKEIQEAVTKFVGAFKKMASEESDPGQQALVDFVVNFGETFLTQPGALYVSKFEVHDTETFVIEGAFVLKLGDQSEAFSDALEKLILSADENGVEKLDNIEIDGKEFKVYPIEDTEHEIIWGVHDGYLYLAPNSHSMNDVLKNAKTPAPQWLNDIRERLKVTRVSTVSYLDTEQLLPLTRMIGERDVEKILMETVGLQHLTHISWVTGLEKDGFVARSSIDFEDGKLPGVFSFIDGAPIKPEDVGRVDKEAMVMLSHRLSTEKIYDFIFEVADEMGGREDIELQIEQFETMTGVELKSEIVDSVDDLVTFYGSINLLSPTSGWVATVKIKNEMVFQGAYRKLNEFVETMADENEFEFKEQTRRGKTIYSVSGLDDLGFFGMEPSWTLDEGELIFSLNRGAVSSHVRRDGSGAENIALQAPLSKLFTMGDDNKQGPIGVVQFDIAQVVELAVSSLRGFLPDDEELIPDSGLYGRDIPTAEVLTNGVDPNITGIYRTPKGIELYQQQTYPGSSPGSMLALGLGLTLPAVNTTRAAARRTDAANRIRQLALAMHNYHDATKALPAQFSTDDEGEPLLSWRVHVLPYIGYADLYDEFRLDEPWDSEHNIQLLEKMPEDFKSPTMRLEDGKTCFLAASGENSLFNAPEENGSDHPKGIRLEDVTDGTSRTIMLVEANESQAVNWTEPKDFDTSADSFLEMLIGVHSAGNNFAFADGSVQMINPNGKDEVLKKLFHFSDGEVVEWEDWQR